MPHASDLAENLRAVGTAKAARDFLLDLDHANIALGLTVCEDTWVEPQEYELDPVGELAAAGANLILNPSCSPWHADMPA